MSTPRSSPQPSLRRTSSPSRLILDAWDDLYNHYYTEYPREACGLILGDGTVLRFHNEATGTNEWVVSEESLARYLSDERVDQEGIFAVYHSHVAGVSGSAVAIPSSEDTEFMADTAELWPGVVHAIMDPHGIGVWGYHEGAVEIGRIDAPAHTR